MWRAWGVVVAAIVVGAASCGGGGAEAGLSPPGTPLAAGLVVPVGAQLVGPVFARVPYEEWPATYQLAVLRIDGGDPFAVWDDLAAQAQDTGLRMPKSSICQWRSTTADPDGLTRYPDLQIFASRPDHAGAMDCQATASGPDTNGTQVSLEMLLWWWADGAELHVQVSEGGPAQPPATCPRFSDRPAPLTAVEQLPARAPSPSGDPGEPFGQVNNCMESYGRLAVPAGTRLIGGGTTPGIFADFAAVLAVEDPEAALRELRDQLDDPRQSNDDYRIAEEPLADGTPVWRLTGGVSAGGGGCDMWSSPDGSAVIVTTISD